MAHILILDDEPDLVWSVAHSLRFAGHEVLAASDGVAGLGLARRHRPDLVILDVIMPGLNGIEVCRRLRVDPSLHGLPILLLTVKNAIPDKEQGFEAGADDYLAKPFDLRELQLRVQALLRRARPAARASASHRLLAGRLCLDLRTCEVIVDDRRALLTPVEFDLLYHLMNHPGEFFSSDRLLQEGWGYPPGTAAPALVRWHIRNLRRKIEPYPNRPRHIRSVPRHGYTLSANSSSPEERPREQG